MDIKQFDMVSVESTGYSMFLLSGISKSSTLLLDCFGIVGLTQVGELDRLTKFKSSYGITGDNLFKILLAIRCVLL